MGGVLAELREAQERLRQKAGRNRRVLDYADALVRLEARMSARTRVVLLGESNSGKTSLANLLLDQAVLPVSVVANTLRPLVLRWSETVNLTGIMPNGSLDLTLGDTEAHFGASLQRLEVGIPNPRLKSFDLVDTPGLSTLRQLDALELGRDDLLVWCTVATQAWKESERRLWMSISGRHRRYAILVATHRDNLRGDEEKHKVRQRLTVEAANYFAAIALVGAGARTEDVGSQPREETGVAELEDLIGKSLSAIAQRRHDAGYRLATHIVREAVKLLEEESRLPVPHVNIPIAQLFHHRRPAVRHARPPSRIQWARGCKHDQRE